MKPQAAQAEQKAQELEDQAKFPARSEKHGSLLSKYTNVEIFAYILAGASAIGATWSSIGRMFADKIKNWPTVVALKEIRNETIDSAYLKYKGINPKVLDDLDPKSIKSLFKDIVNNALDSNIQKVEPISHSEYKKAIIEAEREFSKGYSRYLKEDLKVSSTFDKWKHLRMHQRISTALSIFGVLSIAGVALYTVNKERSARQKLEQERQQRLADKQEEIEHLKSHHVNLEAENYIGREPDYQEVIIGKNTSQLLEQREKAQSAQESEQISYSAR